MDRPDDNGKYPPGYEDIEKVVKETKAKIKEIDAKIELFRSKKSGPYPHPAPSGGPSPPDYDRMIVDLGRQKLELQDGAFRQVEQATQLDRKKGPEVRDRAVNTLFDNEYKNLSPQELRARLKEEKAFGKAQNAFEAHRSRDPRRPERAPEPTPATPAGPSEARWSMSTGFSLPPEPSETRNKARERHKDKDGPER